MKLHETLMKRAREQKLGHFYLVNGQDPMTFVHHFIRQYYQEIENQKLKIENLMDHQDVFVLTHDEDKKEPAFYTVADAEKVSRFFEFKSGHRKFVVIPEAHKINTLVANKWLKVFEEPQGVSTIFLLNANGQKLLPTIESRAQLLRIPVEPTVHDSSAWQEMNKTSREMTLATFLEEYSRGEFDLAFWLNELVIWESQQENSVESKIILETRLQSWKEMEIFHQPTATKWTLFFHHLKDHVHPRIR